MDDKSDCHSEITVDLTHPFGVTLCEIIVYRDYMNAFACQRVEVHRHRSYEGLTFTCLHLCDSSLMQDDTADDLNFVRLHAENSLRSLSYSSKCFRKDIVKCLTCRKSVLEFLSLANKLMFLKL